MQSAFISFLKSAFSGNELRKEIGLDTTKTAYINTRSANKAHSLCFAPSVNMLFDTDGTIKVCCHNSENKIGRYPEQSILDIWNGEAATRFRQAMKEYRFLSGCSACSSDYQNQQFEQLFAKDFDHLPVQTTFPSMMEFLISNTCNLECIMCSGELSSSIRKNRDRLPPLKSPYGLDFVEQLRPFLPHLKEARFSGAGEAFSIPIYYNIWQMLIDINPNCLITIQTNGTVLNTRIKELLERGNFKIGVSVDSVQKENFEAIRVNADFEQVMNNIAYFSAYSKSKGQALSISTCIMRQNWHELPNIIEFCNRIEAYSILHKVWSPLSCSLYNLPSTTLEHIYASLSNISFTPSTTLEKHNVRSYNYILNTVKQWAVQAKEKEANPIDCTQFSTPTLHAKIQQKIKEYITAEDMLEANKTDLIHMCIAKLDQVIAMWEEHEKRPLLEKLYVVPVSEIIASLKIHSVEKLYEMAKSSPI